MTRMSHRALALLALTAACGGPAPRPVSVYFSAPPAAPSPVPLTASSAAPSIVGGTYLVGVFQAQRTIQDCWDATIPGRPSSCASWTLSLPPAPPGYDREVTLDSPIREVSGGPAAFAAGCTEELDVSLWAADDVFYYLRYLPAGPLRLSWPATQITVAACARGAAALKLAPPTGTLRFLPPQ